MPKSRNVAFTLCGVCACTLYAISRGNPKHVSKQEKHEKRSPLSLTCALILVRAIASGTMVDIDVQYPPKGRRKLGYTDVIIVRVRNRDDRRTLPSCKVSLQPNDYHRFATATLEPIKPQQWEEVELKVEVQNPGRPNIRKLCPEFTVEVGEHKRTVSVEVGEYTYIHIAFTMQSLANH